MAGSFFSSSIKMLKQLLTISLVVILISTPIISMTLSDDIDDLKVVTEMTVTFKLPVEKCMGSINTPTIRYLNAFKECLVEFPLQEICSNICRLEKFEVIGNGVIRPGAFAMYAEGYFPSIALEHGIAALRKCEKIFLNGTSSTSANSCFENLPFHHCILLATKQACSEFPY